VFAWVHNTNLFSSVLYQNEIHDERYRRLRRVDHRSLHRLKCLPCYVYPVHDKRIPDVALHGDDPPLRGSALDHRFRRECHHLDVGGSGSVVRESHHE